MTEQLKRFKPSSTVLKRSRKYVYYADQTENNLSLVNSIDSGDFVQLNGPRASGKSSRIVDAMDTLKTMGYDCIYINLHDLDFKSLPNFWLSLGKRFKAPFRLEIKNADDFFEFFSTSCNISSNERQTPVILFIDDFELLYKENAGDICASVLRAIRRIKDEPSRGEDNPKYAIHSIVTISTHVHFRWSKPLLGETLCLLDAWDNLKHKGLLENQVHELFGEFAKDRNITIDYQVVSNIFTKTRGHASLVNICGVAFDEILEDLAENQSINMTHWGKIEHTILSKMYHYGTFQKLAKDLLPKSPLLDFYRSRFLGSMGYETVPIVLPGDRDIAAQMTALGMITPGSGDNFEIASPLVDAFIQRFIIPEAYRNSPTVKPQLRSNGTLDIWEVIKNSIGHFDSEFISRAERLAYKQAEVSVSIIKSREVSSSRHRFESREQEQPPTEPENNQSQPVPRESVYYSELMRVFTVWLSSQYGYRITGDSYHGSILVQVMSEPPIVIEVLATETQVNINEHIDRTAECKKIYGASEAWIVHFTRQEDFLNLPCLTFHKAMRAGVKVIHIKHDEYFRSIRTSTADGAAMEEPQYVPNATKSSKMTGFGSYSRA